MTIIILFNPYSARLPAIVKVGSSAPSSASSGLHKRHNNNTNYDIFVVCGSCHSSKAYSRKHNDYLCPFCDKAGEELLSPIQEEEIEEELEGKKNLDLPDLGVRYSTTDGKTLDKPMTNYDTSTARSFSGRSSSKAVYQVNNDGGRRTRKGESDDFNRICQLDDQILQRNGGITITSDEILSEKSRNVLCPEELAALEKGNIGVVSRRRSLRTW